MRKLSLAAAAVVCFAVAAGPRAVHAQSVDLGSSMQAFCAEPTCGILSFTLDVDGPVYVSNILMRSLNFSIWKFGSLLSVFDATGTDVSVDWIPSTIVTPDELYLVSGTPEFTADPVQFIVQMVQPPNGTQDQIEGNISYFGNGYQSLDANGVGTGRFSVSGTVVVTPEPSTVVLLLSGLIGVVAFARRRGTFVASAD